VLLEDRVHLAAEVRAAVEVHAVRAADLVAAWSVAPEGEGSRLLRRRFPDEDGDRPVEVDSRSIGFVHVRTTTREVGSCRSAAFPDPIARSVLSVFSVALIERGHDRVVESSPDLLNPIVLPRRIHTIAQQYHVEIALPVDPE
jgi:hypothetical protein